MLPVYPSCREVASASDVVVAKEDPEELFVGSEEEHFVTGLEPGATPRWVLEDVGGLGATERDDPGPCRQILHGDALEPSAGGDGDLADDERLPVDVEGLQDVEPERGPDEPRRRQGGGGADVLEPEIPLHHPGQVAVEHPEHHRDLAPSVVE